MENFLIALCMAGIVAVIVYFVKKNKEEKVKTQEKETAEKALAEKIEREKEEDALKAKWEEKKQEFEQRGLPELNIETLKLGQNEVCHFFGEAKFCKLKQQTTGYEGGSRGTSFRVMKGVSFRVGNYKGHYIREQITEKTNGLIYLTNKKIIFTASTNSCVIKYGDIINLNVVEDMLQLQTEKKAYLFQVVDALNFMVILEYILNQI